MSWMDDIRDRLTKQLTIDQQNQIWTTTTSHTTPPPVCEFCGTVVERPPFGYNSGNIDWMMCNTCNDRLKQKIKLILDFK